MRSFILTSRGRRTAVVALAVAALVATGAAASAATTPSPVSIWPSSTPTGVGAATDDTASVELGTAFTAQAAGAAPGPAEQPDVLGLQRLAASAQEICEFRPIHNSHFPWHNDMCIPFMVARLRDAIHGLVIHP